MRAMMQRKILPAALAIGHGDLVPWSLIYLKEAVRTLTGPSDPVQVRVTRSPLSLLQRRQAAVVAVFQHFACCDDLTSIPELSAGASGPEVTLTYHGLSQCVHELQIVPALLNEPAVFSLFEEVVGRSEGSILSGDHLGDIRGRSQGQPDSDLAQGPGDGDPDPAALLLDGRSDLTLHSDGGNLSINSFVLLLVAMSMQARVRSGGAAPGLDGDALRRAHQEMTCLSFPLRSPGGPALQCIAASTRIAHSRPPIPHPCCGSFPEGRKAE
eukprot:gene25830-34418_t